MISIIIPVLNEANNILQVLQPLQKHRGKNIEIVVVDGGSVDNTLELIGPYSDIVEIAEKGRSSQMNVGAKAACGDIYIFLHADTFLPNDFVECIEKAFSGSCSSWGRFDISLSGSALSLRIIEFFINCRSRLTGIATGDQAIFIRAQVFHEFGGYQDIPLMEDVAISKTLKQKTPPLCLKDKVLTSSRRWEEFGIWRTVFLMWQLRLAYFFGVDPHHLVSKYK